MRYALALLFALAAACGRSHDSPKATTNVVDDLRAQRGRYIALEGGHVDAHGFDADDPCDATQRACLRMVSGTTVAYHEAESPSEPGRWYRDSGRTCGVGGQGSTSTFSRDMAIALAYCLWQADDVDAAKRFLAYSDAHGGTMGDGPHEIVATGPLIKYVFETIIAKADKTPLPARPTSVDPDQGTALDGGSDILVGFRAHLAMLGVLLDGLMQGGLTPLEMTFVRDQSSRQPRNALYQAILHKYTDGDQSAAIAILSDESLFPRQDLPTNAMRFSSYLWERDAPSTDWQPDPNAAASPKTFSGTDFIFATTVIADEIRGDKAVAK